MVESMPSLPDDILSKNNSEEQLLYLKKLHQEAETHLKLDDGASALIPALIDYLQKKYKPEALDPPILSDTYTCLHKWTYDDCGEDGYIFVTVQAALSYITKEAMLNEPIKIMDAACSQYIADLEKERKEKPDNKLTQKRLDIITKAQAFLQNNELSNTEKSTHYSNVILNNEAVFAQDKHPRAILFLKAVTVFLAFCFGLGIGGVFAYQILFNQKNKKNPQTGPFTLSIFELSPDHSLELEPDKDKGIEKKTSGPDVS
jgi:hypothetical protein